MQHSRIGQNFRNIIEFKMNYEKIFVETKMLEFVLELDKLENRGFETK
jgi:hypothetical protein